MNHCQFDQTRDWQVGGLSGIDALLGPATFIMAMLRTTMPFVPKEGWAKLAMVPGFSPPFFHVLGSVCSCITSREAAVGKTRWATIRVGNALDGPHVLIWNHRVIIGPGNSSHLDMVLLRHSEADHTIVSLDPHEGALELALSLIVQE